MTNNDSGIYNTAIGVATLVYNIDGSYNTAFCWDAGRSLVQSSYFNIHIGAGVTGSKADTNTIRIGSPYDSSQTPASGQNQTFIAGIAGSPFTASDGPSVVGVTTEGRLGTVPASLLPTGPQGPAGPGLVTGSFLFLTIGPDVPIGYTLLGSTTLAVTAPGAKKPGNLTVNVYRKN